MLSKYLPYPFGSMPSIETSVSLHYDDKWQRWVIITCQQEDGLGLNWREMPQELKEKHLEAKAIVEGMNGIYEYKPQHGKGHTITIKYPELDLFEIGSKARFENSIKLLVVDDEQQIIDLIYDAYSRKGFIIFEATDEVTALEVFQRENPQIMVIDAYMPASVIVGIETLKKIRQINQQACCIVTTHIEQDQWSMQQAKELGAIAYFVKPFSEEKFDASITEAKGFVKLCQEVEKWNTSSN